MGLAKIETDSNHEDISMLTGATAIMGTVDFMSPEQGFSSRDVDARADIYSLGATLFYLLTGKFMYAGNSAFAKLLAHRESPIPSLCSAMPGLPLELENIFSKMVAKNAADRYASMAQVISALSSLGNKDAKTADIDRVGVAETLGDGLAVTIGLDDIKIISANEPVKGSTIPAVVSKPSLFKSAFQKPYNPKVLVVALALVLISVAFVCFVLIKPSANVDEEASNQIELKQDEEKALQLEA
jgi:serine/threonine protein kinase